MIENQRRGKEVETEKIIRLLDGITILELTRLLPGAVAMMMQADFGAEVVKIEEPGVAKSWMKKVI